jgi:hypothetical protein
MTEVAKEISHHAGKVVGVNKSLDIGALLFEDC